MTQEAVETVESNEASASIKAGYDRVANPDYSTEPRQIEAKPEPVKVEEVKEETPEPETTLSGEQIKDLLAQVARIPTLEKRLMDGDGRYGALKQAVEQMKQRITAPTIENGGSASQEDIDDMLKEVKEVFGEDELYQSLKHAFARVMKASGGKQVDPAEIEKAIIGRIESEREASIKEALNQLTEDHPTWMQDRETPEFKEWIETLSARDRKRLNNTYDPYYVSEKFDAFKEWKKSKEVTPKQEEVKPHMPSKRLTNAVLPTSGVKPALRVDDAKSSIRAGYERVAGARMR